MSSQVASLLPLDQELYLRALTGRLVGEHLFDGFRKVAVITYPDRICSAMAVAALTSFTYPFNSIVDHPGLSHCLALGRVSGRLPLSPLGDSGLWLLAPIYGHLRAWLPCLIASSSI